MQIILASSSPARYKQLSALGIDFIAVSPNIDETPLPNESITALVSRLAEQKARAVAESYPNAVIIAGDQMGEMQGKLVGKPLTAANAIAHLRAARGQTMQFYSGVCVLNTQTNCLDVAVITTTVVMRNLTSDEIKNYVHKAQPMQCAGSFNVESLGIALFEKIHSDDPSALIGLPMITVVSLLKKHGIKIF